MAFAYKVHSVQHAEQVLPPPRRYRAAEYFVIFEILSQLALLVPAFEARHGLFRAATFGASLFLLPLALIPGRRRHPAARAAIVILAILALSILNPMRNSWLSAFAQLVLYGAILAPLFWVPGLNLDSRTWYRVLFILWVFHTLSATTGILQVYFPGRFQPNVSSVLADRLAYLKALRIDTETGQLVFRPMGLTDAPAGAATAGLYAVCLGLLLFVREKRRLWLRLALAASMPIGLAAIALSQVRTTMVMVAVCVTAFLVLLQLRNFRVRGRRTRFGERISKANILLAALTIGGTLTLGGTLALSLANKTVTKRITSLFSESPGQVYLSNRGYFLENTIDNLLPKYPLGAGPGRWGMMYSYFGNPSNLDSPMIWAEIQWTGWLLDGGVPLILAYVYALGLCLSFALRTALDRNATELGVFAAFVFAYDLAALSQTFDDPFFISQGGMEFWFMNALLFATALAFSRRGVRRLRS